MHPDDLRHQLLIREVDIVEDAPAQEGIRQFLFRVGCDDDDGALLGLHRPARFRNIEFHLIQFPQQIVGKFQIGFIDLVNQQDHLLFTGECLAQLSQLHVLLQIVHAAYAHLAVVEPLHHVVDVQSVLGLGGGFDVPDQQFFAQSRRNGLSQHCFAGARLAFYQQRLLQSNCNIGHLQ